MGTQQTCAALPVELAGARTSARLFASESRCTSSQMALKLDSGVPVPTSLCPRVVCRQHPDEYTHTVKRFLVHIDGGTRVFGAPSLEAMQVCIKKTNLRASALLLSRSL